MNILRNIFRSCLVLIAFQVFATEHLEVGVETKLEKLNHCKDIKQPVGHMLDFVVRIGEEEENMAAEEVEAQLEKKLSAFIDQPHLPQKLLCLQSIIGEGGGKYWEVAQVALYRICAKVEASRLLPQLVPYLKLPKTDRRHISEILSLISMNAEGNRFQRWEPYLHERRNVPPLKLIEWMYADWTDSAFKTLIDVYTEKGTRKRQELIDAANTVNNWKKMQCWQAKASPEEKKSTRQHSIKILTELGKYQEWWVQLYVAEKLKQNPKLRDPELIEQLKKSKSPVVSATIQEIEDEKK